MSNTVKCKKCNATGFRRKEKCVVCRGSGCVNLEIKDGQVVVTPATK